MPTYQKTKLLIESLINKLSKINSESITAEIFNLREELEDLNRDLKREAKSRQSKGVFSTFFKKPTATDSNFDEFFEDAKDIEKAIDQIKKHSNSINQKKSDFKDFIDEIKQKLEAFYQVYGLIFTYTESDKRFLGIGDKNEIYSMPVGYGQIKHVYCIGGTGSGKSKLLEAMVLQDILSGRGGCIIDPFGGLFRDVSSFCFYYDELREYVHSLKERIEVILSTNTKDIPDFKRYFSTSKYRKSFQIIDLLNKLDPEEVFAPLNVKVIDLSKSANSTTPNPYRINPFELHDGDEIDELVDILIRSVERHTGQSANETPQLSTIMEGLFSYMIVGKKNLNDLLEIINTLISYAGNDRGGNSKIPADLFQEMENSENPTVRLGAWSLKFLLQSPKREFVNAIHSTANRLKLFINRISSHLLDTPQTTLNLEREINDTSERRPFLLFNIPSNNSKSRMVATFILTKIDQIVRDREEGQKKLSFYCYLDEFYEFLDLELAKNFAKVRQFGLGYICAHQNFSQLLEHDPKEIIRETVFDNTSIQLVMRIKHDSARYVVENCFRATGKVMRESYATADGRNVGVRYTFGYSQSKGNNESETKSSSKSKQWSKTFSETVGKSLTIGSGSSTQTGKSEGQGTTQGGSNTKSVLTPNDYSLVELKGSRTVASADTSSQQKNTQINESNTSTFNKTETDNKSQTEGQSEGGSDQEGSSIQKGTSNQEGSNFGLGLSDGYSRTETITATPISFDEEREILAQDISGMDDRELFICYPKLVTFHARTIDSITVTLAAEMKHITGNCFYPYLEEQQKHDRHEMIELLQSSDLENKMKSQEKEEKLRRILEVDEVDDFTF